MATQRPDPEKVEQLVASLVDALGSHGTLHVTEGLSAAMTFTSRFARGVIALSPTPADRMTNVKHICHALREIATEFEQTEMVSGTVH